MPMMSTSVITQAATIPLAVLLKEREKHKSRKKYVAFINSVIAYKLKGCERNDNPINM